MMSLPRSLRRAFAGPSDRSSRLLRVLCVLLAAAVPWASRADALSARLGELSRNLASNRSAANFRSLSEFAGSASGLERDLAHYAIGMARYKAKQYPFAEEAFGKVGGASGWLREYSAYYEARSVVLAEDFERALARLAAYRDRFPKSRFAPAAERLQVESLLRLGRLDQARDLLESGASGLEAPVRHYLGGRVEHVSGNLRQAVYLYRQAYYHYPFSDQAEASELQLNTLRSRMRGSYPSAQASWRLARAEALHDGRSYAKASAEFTRALAAGLSGADRDRAVILRGASDYARGSTSAAYRALAGARPADPTLDAQRLYLLCALERRQRLVGPMLSSLGKLADRHADSQWYEEALLMVGNYYYLLDDRREYPKVFKRLAEAFPKGKHAPYAHWKVCWRAWLDRSSGRRELLEEHVRQFPGAPTVPAALYWLGRLSEGEGNHSKARACYLVIVRSFPHYYYAVLARERLRGASAGSPGPGAELELAEAIPYPRALAAEARPQTLSLLEIGTTLRQIGLGDEARQELSRIEFQQPDAHFAGLELARLHAANKQHYLGLRAMKRYAFGYLRFPLDSLDREYWEHLFPLGWADILRARAGRHRLDPYLVAALVRQESEFNPVARSRVGALGLMQIMPSTGRSLFRRLGIAGFSNRKLTVPDVSLRLGTFHLKEVLAKFDGQVEKALAGYNAGDSRVPQWMKLGPFKEIAEFVETIPFSETRGYVQSVMRNRAMYERLYAE